MLQLAINRTLKPFSLYKYNHQSAVVIFLRLFLSEVHMIYLDNAATTLVKPPMVKEAIVSSLSTLGNANRGATRQSLDTSFVIYEARANINQLINGTSPNQVVFTSNATESLNIAIKGTLQPGDHVITTVMEHNSVLRPLYELEEKGLEISFVNVNADGVVNPNDIADNIQSNTKAIIITHESNVTGNIIPIEDISKIATANKLLLIVDASQTMGTVPIDVQALDIDVLCFTGHKSLFGPQGTGGMYVKEGVDIAPLKTGGSGIKTYEKKHPSQMPTALEAGTMNGHGIAGLNAGVKFILQEGVKNICKHQQDLISYFYDQIKSLENITIYGDFTGPNHGSILAVNIGKVDSSLVADDLLNDYGISTRSGGHCAPLMHQALGTDHQGVVRFSTSYFTKKEEIDSAVEALTELVNKYK